MKDAFLQEALTIATTKFIGLRREAFGDFPEGEKLRDMAREIKEATLQHLDRYLEQLIDNVERLGGKVHFASTAAEARGVILEIARQAGARMAVKSKSMATEEIHLNEALEQAGITPVETDLREDIIQLAHEPPSHILAPAIPKTKGPAAELFVQGPRRAGELEGPEELHLVLLDNGRINQLAGPLREALYCLRCGACLNVCPVYRQIGGHAYGHTYPGPIGILLTAMLSGPASVKELPHASSLLRACADACPVRIDIPRMLIELPREVDGTKIAPP